MHFYSFYSCLASKNTWFVLLYGFILRILRQKNTWLYKGLGQNYYYKYNNNNFCLLRRWWMMTIKQLSFEFEKNVQSCQAIRCLWVCSNKCKTIAPNEYKLWAVYAALLRKHQLLRKWPLVSVYDQDDYVFVEHLTTRNVIHNFWIFAYQVYELFSYSWPKIIDGSPAG